MQHNYKDIILIHNKSVLNSRSEADTSTKLGKHVFSVPVVAANMKSIITPEICKQFDEENWFYVYHRIDGTTDVLDFVEYANQNLNITSISVGVKEEWVKFVEYLKLRNFKVDYFTVDVALSYNDNVLPVLKAIKEFFPESYVILGNGSTGKWAEWVMENQLADCIKVGIGVSKSCQTRQFTAYGSSTITSLQECYKAISDYSRELFDSRGNSAQDRFLKLHPELEDKPFIIPQIMSDGGITILGDTVCIGDIAKSLIVGHSDFVMSGALFSRCIDSPSLINGYYGNASERAKEHSNHIEGRTITVKSNGLTIKEMMKLIEESLRSSISYSGGSNINDMKRLTKWDYIT